MKTINQIESDIDGTGLRIGVILSRFNSEIGEGLWQACMNELLKQGVVAQNITYATVPGALEVPLALQMMAKTGRFDALIALGAVIRGDTYHFEIVSNESASGITNVQLHCGIPIANGILTTENDEQARVRMTVKGAEAALAAIEMANLAKRIK